MQYREIHTRRKANLFNLYLVQALLLELIRHKLLILLTIPKLRSIAKVKCEGQQILAISKWGRLVAVELKIAHRCQLEVGQERNTWIKSDLDHVVSLIRRCASLKLADLLHPSPLIMEIP